jgi:hypothetical protein
MSRGWSFKSGDWIVHCDVCSKPIYASEAKHRWDGFIVCPDDWEPRHSLDFVRARQDKISVPFSRPEPEDTFVTVNYVVGLSCTPLTSTGLADFAASGCARSGITLMGGL